eukprot:CAMPEP_0176375212 /NCGR_PEP_ID=MMETSP0126-20121128/27352_1 /TAXON_ID=141414 ORGANISM="Strombidinopsis acuminatum, Strain SPMC142" /NCGR_SAMPLE_ID=MMETSP0126 /ASSEMBLY_ACC=CAM_ASM_000229 /LENGTH=290 /DNA_ID=CAMNT_0017736203 /DNA_START=828 /DNA_END=1700 /DNA_ORIENTATION=+
MILKLKIPHVHWIRHTGRSDLSKINVTLLGIVGKRESEGRGGDNLSIDEGVNEIRAVLMVIDMSVGAETQDTINIRREQLVIVDQEEFKFVNAIRIAAQANLVSTSVAFNVSTKVFNLLDIGAFSRLPRFGSSSIKVLTKTALALCALDSEPIGAGIIDNLDTLALGTHVERTSIDHILIVVLEVDLRVLSQSFLSISLLTDSAGLCLVGVDKFLQLSLEFVLSHVALKVRAEHSLFLLIDIKIFSGFESTHIEALLLGELSSKGLVGLSQGQDYGQTKCSSHIRDNLIC